MQLTWARPPGPAISTLAAAMLLSIGLATPATAATGGAGLSVPSAKAPAATTLATRAPALTPVAGIPQIAASLALRKVSRRAASAATLRYVSHAGQPLTVRVDVVRLSDGMSIFHDERSVPPEAAQTLRWNGRADNGVALDGRYELRIALGDVASSSTSAAPTSGGAGVAGPEGAPPPPGSASLGRFTFVGAVFPVLGPHDYGGRSGRFGAGRTGHIHEGQDVMAACGTPLVAARGGIVAMRARQWAAGNYLVIHDPVTSQDYMYAHLREPAIVRKGARVETGQPIGVVGETGDATACHLHFEIWTAPGWYAGGAPIDPLPTLKSWDKPS
jgi:murein DD-endopeptidase MepM/ murein hydrolase activator NlpD